MSFILKALKKVEEERTATMASQADLHGMAPSRPGSRDRRGKPLLLVAMLLMFAAGGTITWFAARKLPERSQPPAVAIAPQATAVPTGPVQPAQPPQVQPVTGQAVPAPLQAQTASPAPPAPPVATAAAPAPPAEAPPPAPKRRKPAPVRANRVSNVALVPAPQGLTLNGIAVQDDSSRSIAIVNGMMLKKGMTVQGATVEKITPYAVLFSGNGGRFELQLPK